MREGRGSKLDSISSQVGVRSVPLIPRLRFPLHLLQPLTFRASYLLTLLVSLLLARICPTFMGL